MKQPLSHLKAGRPGDKPLDTENRKEFYLVSTWGESARERMGWIMRRTGRLALAAHKHPKSRGRNEHQPGKTWNWHNPNHIRLASQTTRSMPPPVNWSSQMTRQPITWCPLWQQQREWFSFLFLQLTNSVTLPMAPRGNKILRTSSDLLGHFSPSG